VNFGINKRKISINGYVFGVCQEEKKMLKPNIKYRVTLTAEERQTLKNLIQTGHTAEYRMRHAQILLALDEIPAHDSWTDKKIGAAYGSSIRTIGYIRKRFVEEGFQAAVGRKKRLVPSVIKIDGEAKAKIIALARSEAPEGRSRWTFRLLTDKVVEAGILDSISDTAIRKMLRKTKLDLGWRKNGVFPPHPPGSLSGGGRNRYAALQPVICLDETSRQPIGESGEPLSGRGEVKAVPVRASPDI
jgi:hypothetical protein